MADTAFSQISPDADMIEGTEVPTSDGSSLNAELMDGAFPDFDATQKKLDSGPSHFQKWGALWILVAMFAVSWVGQALTMRSEIVSHGWGPFWNGSLENWQAEWLSLIVQGALLLALGHQLFKADKVDTERLEQKVDETRFAVAALHNWLWELEYGPCADCPPAPVDPQTDTDLLQVEGSGPLL